MSGRTRGWHGRRQSCWWGQPTIGGGEASSGPRAPPMATQAPVATTEWATLHGPSMATTVQKRSVPSKERPTPNGSSTHRAKRRWSLQGAAGTMWGTSVRSATTCQPGTTLRDRSGAQQGRMRARGARAQGSSRRCCNLFEKTRPSVAKRAKKAGGSRCPHLEPPVQPREPWGTNEDLGR